jgi:ABC-type transport system involved in multi-copper enzyme maturation permease subunit
VAANDDLIITKCAVGLIISGALIGGFVGAIIGILIANFSCDQEQIDGSLVIGLIIGSVLIGGLFGAFSIDFC